MSGLLCQHPTSLDMQLALFLFVQAQCAWLSLQLIFLAPSLDFLLAAEQACLSFRLPSVSLLSVVPLLRLLISSFALLLFARAPLYASSSPVPLLLASPFSKLHLLPF